MAVLAAYSGYAAAKWATESSVTLAKASAERTKANRADYRGDRDSNGWIPHRSTPGSPPSSRDNANDERLAVKRMRPGYRPAFDAWLATDPAHNPHAPPGPAYMPQYVIPQDATARSFDTQADAAFTTGSDAGATSDKYIRDTVFLATVLFLVGISGHFRIRQARLGLIGVGGLILAFAVVQLLGLPAPPS